MEQEGGSGGLARTQTGRALLSARVALRLLTVFLPRTAGRLFLLDPEANPQLPYLGRMWGIRNLALAAGLAGARGPSRRRWSQINVLVDLVDAFASYDGWRRKELPTPTAAFVSSVALCAVGLGAASVAGETDPEAS
jgi:hypothetical protein